MNPTIKRGLIELHDFTQDNLPIILYPDVIKYKNVPFLINKHADLELLFVKDGKIEMHLDDTVFWAKKDTVIVANSNVLHNIIPLTESISYDCIIIDKAFCERYGFMINQNHIQEIIQDPKLFEHMNHLKNIILRQKEAYRTAEITSTTLQLLIRLFKYFSHPIEINKNYTNRSMLEKGIEYIHDHFREEINVEKIAAHAGYSKFYFCRKFKETTGCTVNNYVNMRRISYAKEQLIRKNELSIGKIAADSGFENFSYFSKVFQKYTNYSPFEYKKQVNKPQH